MLGRMLFGISEENKVWHEPGHAVWNSWKKIQERHGMVSMLFGISWRKQKNGMTWYSMSMLFGIPGRKYRRYDMVRWVCWYAVWEFHTKKKGMTWYGGLLLEAITSKTSYGMLIGIPDKQ